jgi:hypothetical protein
MKIFNNKKPQVYFETDNWAVRKYAPIQPAKHFIPKKFLQMPVFLDKKEKMIDSTKTVRACPGISEYFGLGYVIPAWCDIEIYPMDDETVRARYSDPSYNHGHHLPEQMQQFMEKTFKVRTPIRLDNPWRTYTSKGWSLLYLPMLYHEEQNWQAMPGITDNDIGALQGPINIMLKDPVQTLIKQGEPLCQVIPIYRDNVVARTGSIRPSTHLRNNSIIQSMFMSFKGWAHLMREHKRYQVDAHDTDLPE